MSTSTLDGLCEAYARVSALNSKALNQFLLVAEQIRHRHIDFMLLKGGDLLTRLYAVRGLRPMADVDLLVHEGDLLLIDETLRSMGYRQAIDGNPAYTAPDQSVTLDLISSIWYLDSESHMAALWQRAVPRVIEGRSVKAMSSDDLLIYLTAYTVLHRGHLGPRFAQDLSLLVKKEALDWNFILEEAARHNLRVPLYHGLSFARSFERDLQFPEDVMTALKPSGLRERMLAFVLRKLVTTEFTEGLGHCLLCLTRPGRKKIRWIAESFFPPRPFLGYRYGHRGLSHPLRTRFIRMFSLLGQACRLFPGVLVKLVKPSPLR